MSVARKLLFGAAVGGHALKHTFSKDPAPTPDLSDSPLFVLIGGELYNKGAQAMTFTVVDRLRDEFPDCKIYLFSSMEYVADRGTDYQFTTLPWDEDVKLHLLGYRQNALRETDWDPELVETVRSTFANATAILDISGYSLSSQLGIETTVSYMTDILLATKYQVPYFILPQSMGPFEYGFPKGIVANILFRIYFPRVSLICPREQEGVAAVRQYTDDVNLERDLVFQRDGLDAANISLELETDIPDLESNSVGLVPNRNVFRYADEDMMAVYEAIVEHVSETHDTYILRHAADDERICERLGRRFEDNPRVHTLNEDYNSIQLERIIAEFEFVVASRYHSIVHAYRSGVPAVVISWAEKYRELVELFDQAEYLHDCRDSVRESDLEASVRAIAKARDQEQKKLATTYEELREDGTVLDAVFENLRSNS